MSWLPRSTALGPGRADDPEPDWSEWRCDHCTRVFETVKQPPMHRREAGEVHQIWPADGRRCRGLYVPEKNRAVHYCSDECVEPHDAVEVKRSLKLDMVKQGLRDYLGAQSDEALDQIAKKYGAKLL